MGRIKSLLVKKAARQLLVETPDSFNADFEHNKKVLVKMIPTKRMRNSIAGYITRLKKKTD